MDSQSLTVLIGAASLVVGVLACWLVMRGRIAAAAAQGKAKVEIELVKATERMQALDADRQATVANYEEMMKAQAAKSRDALSQARQEQTRQLSEREARGATLEAQLLALQAQEKASQQELKRALASNTDHLQSLRRESDRLAATEGENATLKRNLADISATLEDLNRRPPTTREEQATQLPILEIEVFELQSLAKTIQQEFLVLQEVQRNFTAASSALQDVS